ncbi:MAG: hypothetical protein HDR31_00735 [Mycoplasma sp.]|nr:hypothetical protein [Mycoplasma sp.]
MNFLKILQQISLVLPDWIQKIIFFILYYIWSYPKYHNHIKISEKENLTSSDKNLVIIDNMKAVGDFFILLNLVKNIDSQQYSEKKYVFVVNNMFKKIIDNQEFKNCSFIFLEKDFGTHYNRVKFSKKDIIEKYNYISNKILNYSRNWNNIFICSGAIDLSHYSMLSLISYKNAYVIKNILNKSKTRLVIQNQPIPSISLWIYFFHFYKKFKINVWTDQNKNIYYFSHMCFNMIKIHDNFKNTFNYFSEKKQINNNNSVTLMLKTSNKYKNINISSLYSILNNIEIIRNKELIFLGKERYNLPENKNFILKNLTGKTTDFLEFIKTSQNSFLCITADTSLYHISSFYNIPTIVFINSKIKKTNVFKSFWLENNKNNLIIVSKYIFKKNSKKSIKEFKEIEKQIKFFISQYSKKM